MIDRSTGSPPVEQARELFFAQGLAPDAWVSPHISRSWQRCRPLANDAVDPAPMPLSEVQVRRERAARLLECAQPELDGLAEHAVGNGCVVVLTDASGLILDEIGSPEFLPKAERIALMPGIEWSEHNRGTNAIGTALAEQDALLVLGREHYLLRNGVLDCAAAPIFNGRGVIAGLFDISGEAGRLNQHALGLVRMAAQQVQHRMMLAEARGSLLRFHRRPGVLGTAREGLIEIDDDGRIVAGNGIAHALLGTSPASLLGQSVDRVLGLRWARLERGRGLVTLPGGQQIAAMVERATPRTVVPVRGTVLEATPAQAVDAVLPFLQKAVRVLDEGLPVLISGETGSGKEVFARRLHGASRRRAGPFVAVNCAALPDSLIESELFGYDEGAFTGARRRGMPGRLREAHGGVLFLDEIADMPLALQTRLLRVLEERVVVPLGGGEGVPVDFDLVCASHGDLQALAAAGRFRPDLLYRVAGFTVDVPPLRLRADKEELIARLFMEWGGAAKRLRLEAQALAQLAAWRWPGNIRELRSVLRSIVALSEPGESIWPDRLPAHLGATHVDPAASATLSAPSGVANQPLAETARHAIDQALESCGHNVGEAAQQLGVHRSTIYRHLARRRAH